MTSSDQRTRTKVDNYTDDQYERKLAVAQDGPLLVVVCLGIGAAMPLAIGARWVALVVVVVAALVLGAVAWAFRRRVRARTLETPEG
ncbi:hypothetical protein [Rhabdothermincola salaria]|uniref:hypothetical protein n=1 Tax=Rhabdothermincola salaria TaxID=2903142 RepID=UPI001E46F657|nr:hypothetical protein [Rhabdothermincola salaria]MCD9622838.1 hypothetical protein [Rhabdothermincola salaria]